MTAVNGTTEQFSSQFDRTPYAGQPVRELINIMFHSSFEK